MGANKGREQRTGAEQEGGTALPFLWASPPLQQHPLERNTEHLLLYLQAASRTHVWEQV